MKIHVSRHPDRCVQALYRSIEQGLKDPKKKAILLVPDQYTVEAEQALLDFTGQSVLFRVQVKSFRSLAEEIVSRGAGRRDPVLSPVGRRMLLRLLLEKDDTPWSVFRKSVRGTGFLDLLADQLLELKEYDIGPQDLLTMADHLEAGSLSRQKLEETAQLMAQYEAALARVGEDADDHLKKAYQQLVQRPGDPVGSALSDYFSHTDFFFEHFHSLSAHELGYLSALSLHGRLEGALLLDPLLAKEVLQWPLEGEEESLKKVLDGLVDDAAAFSLSVHFLLQLRRMAEAQGQSVMLAGPEGRDQEQEKEGADPLAALSRAVFSYRPVSAASASSCLSAFEFRNTEDEVSGLSVAVRHLVASGQARYRDIQVILLDWAEYAPFLRGQWAENQLPYFADEEKSVHFHPLIKLVESLLALMEKGPRKETYLALLKTGLLGLSDAEVEIYQKYIEKRQLAGAALEEDRYFTLDDAFYQSLIDRHLPQAAAQLAEETQEAKKVKDQLTALLRPFRQLPEQEQAPFFCRKLYAFLSQPPVYPAFLAYGKSLEEEGEEEGLALHQQLWAELMALLDSAVEISGATPLSPKIFVQMLQEGLADLHLGVIPPGQDQILVSTLLRSRSRTRAYVFILGLTDANLPSSGAGTGLFTELEKEAFRKRGFFLPSSPDFQAEEERLNFYSSLRKVQKKLFLFTSRLSRDNAPLQPSFWLESLRVAGKLPLHFIGSFGPSEAAYARSLRQVLLPKALRQDPAASTWLALKNSLKISPNPEDEALFQRALSYTNERPCLSAPLARTLLQKEREVSATSLEAYAACPYQGFARHILRLEEGRRLALDPLDIGNLLHDSLSAWSGWVNAHLDQVEQWPDALSLAALEGAFDKAKRVQMDQIRRSDPRNAFFLELTWKSLQDASQQVLHQIQHSRFLRMDHELAFGRGQAYPPLPLLQRAPNGVEVSLRGRIDRVDELQIPQTGQVYRQVIDYKSGRRAFDLTRLIYGLDLQLPLYLRAVTRNARPLGFFFMSLRPAPLVKLKKAKDRQAYEKALAQSFLGEVSLDGLLVRDPEVLHAADQAIRETPKQFQSDIYKMGSSRKLLVPQADGTLGPHPDGVSEQERLLSARAMDELMDQALAKASQLEEKRALGILSPAPYRLKNKESACQYCPYRALCRFEPRGQFGKYRSLPSLSLNEWKGAIHD